MSDGDGYMLNSATEQTLIYPETSLYGANSRLDNSDNQTADEYWSVKVEISMSTL